MRTIVKSVWMLVAVLATCELQPASARADEGYPDDKTLSPYFAVENADPATDHLPLKSTDVKVRVLGVIAEVVVTQQYTNDGEVTLEARYVFPASTRAAVHAMTVRLGDRLITPNFRDKAAARADYDSAKREGRTAALLEQHRDNVFQMHVGNILPGDDVRVELSYTELLTPTDGVYQFVYPTVVGPRYNGAPGEESYRPELWLSTPYLRDGVAPNTTFRLAVDLESPIPFSSISSPSHALSVQGERSRKAHVELEDTSEPADSRDFVLEYRLDGEQIQSGVMLSEGPDENFFLAMVQPPATVPRASIVPREYVFVVDVSGSMNGFPLDTTRELMRDLLARLRPSDTFNLMLFAGDNRVLSPQSLPVTEQNVKAALAVLANESGSGGTELVPALRKALAMPSDGDRSRVFVVVTDGYVSVDREIFDLVRRNLSQANLFAFGIGSSVNRALIEGLARAGQGEPFVVLEPRLAAEQASRFRQVIETPVMTRISVRFDGFDAYDATPLEVPDLFARRPVVVFGKWRGEARGTVVVEGSTTLGTHRARLEVDDEAPSPSAGSLRYLWARHRIAELTDQDVLTGDGGERDAILALGLRYNLLTQYTSFIAIDRLVRIKDPDRTLTVDQPLPLPKGVSELAIGGSSVPSTPEPSMWALLAIASLMLGFAMRRRLATAVVKRS
jgi:Ca-activated chloride channel family protein